MHNRQNHGGGTLPQRFILLLAFGFFSMLAVWITILGTSVVSILADTDDSSSQTDSSVTTTVAPTTTEAPIDVSEPITVDTIRNLKKEIRFLERQIAHGGGAGGNQQDELFAVIEQKAALQRQLSECQKQQQQNHPVSSSPPSPRISLSPPVVSPPDRPAATIYRPPNSNKNNNNNNIQQQREFPAEKSGGHVVFSNGGSHPDSDPAGTIPILVLCYNRPNELKRILTRIGALLSQFPYKSFPHVPRFRLIVSQDSDGVFPEVGSVVRDAQQNWLKSLGVVYLSHTRDDTGATREEADNRWEPYLAISRHYAWALASTFTKVNKKGAYERVIVLEEDLELADDFFEYMAAMSPLFDLQKKNAEQQLYCVSGFNDNGKSVLVGDARGVYRSDFFPGLGWMMSRRLWEQELRAKWPRGFWDDWMRQPVQRLGRSCVRPEISRSRAMCRDGEGASGGQFCEHLSQIVLYSRLHDETRRDSVLKAGRSEWEHFKPESLLPAKYDAQLQRWLAEARVVFNIASIDTLIKEMGRQNGGGGGRREIKMMYPNNDAFEIYAQSFNLMSDFKDNVPRTAYKGVVSFRWRGAAARIPIPPQMLPFENDVGVVRVHLVPERVLYK